MGSLTKLLMKGYEGSKTFVKGSKGELRKAFKGKVVKTTKNKKAKKLQKKLRNFIGR